MINKLEQKLDREFERIGVHVYTFHIPIHFNSFISTIQSVTFATIYAKWEWPALSRLTYYLIYDETNMASTLLNTLKNEGLYGVAICDRRDQFNRQRGRIIAKGRLLKHLKEIAK